MDEIEIKITFSDDLCGCEIQKDGETVFFESLNRLEQIHVCNAFALFYDLFVPCIKKRGKDEND